MRLYQQFRASISRSALMGAAVLLFASGMSVSAFGQATQPSATRAAALPASQEAAAAPGTPVSIEEAVRMALENNLGIQIEKLNPQIEVLGVSRARAVYAPSLLTGLSRRSATSPPTDFNTSGANQLVSTNSNFASNGGLQQQMRWGGAYSVVFDGSRATTNDINPRFNPQLGSGLNATVTQPLLRNFKIDANRQQVLLAKNQLQAADLNLQQRLTQTGRSVRAAYYALVGSIAGLEVAQESLNLSRTSLKNNQTRVEVGTMAPIDIVQAKAEVAANEESVIVAEGLIRSAEDNLRTLVMNPAQPDFWTTKIEPSDQPTVSPQAIDLDAAVANALANRIDLAQARKQIEQTDIGLRFYRNQKLPALDVTANYDLVGTAGTQRQFGLDTVTGEPIVLSESQRNFSQALRDVFGNQFRTWSVQLNVSYPLGRSVAEAAVAQGRLQREQQSTTLRDLQTRVVASVREAGRQVSTSLKRVESTRKARELAEQSLQAEEKRLAVGLSDTFRLFQAQRDLARQRVNELNAVISYSRALVDFEAVQSVPLR
jgi:outer membrane protein